MDQLGQIVFEKALALGLEERDDLLVVGRVGRGEAEIDLLAALIERHALQPERDGAVLDIRERQRVETSRRILPLRRRDILLEHLAHALRIDAVGRDLVAEPGRIIEAQGDRLVDPGERPLRAARQRVEVLAGQVEPPRKEPGGDDVEPTSSIARCRRARRATAAARAGEREAGHGTSSQSAFSRSTRIALAAGRRPSPTGNRPRRADR